MMVKTSLLFPFLGNLLAYGKNKVVPEIAQTDDALLIQVDPGLTPMCTFVPRQLTRDQIISLVPKSWITKYESLHQAIQLIQSNNPFFIKKENGEVETRFLKAPPKKKDITVSPT
ncbi:hypothetical protein SO802_012970 [Lithocarpus litseifolius]|uniref:Uncharacterized protein n=1 Tax=Lithocarpus litseifolius TaxID=425828 RepID=A0AAW2D6Z0_9ROSI